MTSSTAATHRHMARSVYSPGRAILSHHVSLSPGFGNTLWSSTYAAWSPAWFFPSLVSKYERNSLMTWQGVRVGGDGSNSAWARVGQVSRSHGEKTHPVSQLRSCPLYGVWRRVQLSPVGKRAMGKRVQYAIAIPVNVYYSIPARRLGSGEFL